MSHPAAPLSTSKTNRYAMVVIVECESENLAYESVLDQMTVVRNDEHQVLYVGDPFPVPAADEYGTEGLHLAADGDAVVVCSPDDATDQPPSLMRDRENALSQIKRIASEQITPPPGDEATTVKWALSKLERIANIAEAREPDEDWRPRLTADAETAAALEEAAGAPVIASQNIDRGGQATRFNADYVRTQARQHRDLIEAIEKEDGIDYSEPDEFADDFRSDFVWALASGRVDGDPAELARIWLGDSLEPYTVVGLLPEGSRWQRWANTYRATSVADAERLAREEGNGVEIAAVFAQEMGVADEAPYADEGGRS